ncbi:MAG: stage II sporulation protein M [Rhizomicrobium sp.]
MDAPTLKSHRFRGAREADWRRLERLLDRFEKGRSADLSDDDVVAIPVLYRSALSSLSAARAVSLDQDLIAYLESLCTRAYFCVYGTRSTVPDRIVAFLTKDWSAAVRALWRETIVSAVLGVLGAAAAYLLVRADSAWFYAFMPAGLAGGRDPGASTQALRDSIFHPHGTEGLAFFSSFLFTHNSEVSLLAFALGFAVCLPTAFLLFYNGLTLGALLAVYAAHGLGVDFMGWILIHGVTELFAITLAGAAGLRIGWSLAFPGEDTRIEALKKAGRIAATAMVGVVVMLLCAGLLEGFARQLITSTLVRYAVAAASGVFWLGYFYRPVRRP